jgi:hypothetical protein
LLTKGVFRIHGQRGENGVNRSAEVFPHFGLLRFLQIPAVVNGHPGLSQRRADLVFDHGFENLQLMDDLLSANLKLLYRCAAID